MKGWGSSYGRSGPPWAEYGYGGSWEMPRYGYDGYDSYGYDMAPYAPGNDYSKGSGKGAKDAKGLVRGLLASNALPVTKWDNDDNTLYVGGLPSDMTDLEMYVLFSPFGRIAPRGASARIDKDTGKCTGIGFVNYLESGAAEQAIRRLHGFPFPDGTWLTVKKKGPPKERAGR